MKSVEQESVQHRKPQYSSEVLKAHCQCQKAEPIYLSTSSTSIHELWQVCIHDIWKSYLLAPWVSGTTTGHKENMNFGPFGLWQMFPKEGPNEANNKISHSSSSFLGFHASLFSMDVHFCGVFSLLTCKSSLPIISIAKVLKWCWQHRTIDVKWMT